MVNNTLNILLNVRQDLFEAQQANGELEFVDIHIILKRYIDAEKDNPQNINDLKQKMGLSYANENLDFTQMG